ncbi:MAG: DMT family transporter [Pseudomonadota bacterium]
MTNSQWLWLVLLSVLWGGSFFFVGVAVDEVPPLTLVAARVAIAALAILPVVFALGHRLPLTVAAWLPFAGMALFNNIIPFTSITLAQAHITSGLAAVLNATTPLMSVLMLRLFVADEPLTAAKLGGILLGIAGVAILMGPDALQGLDAQLAGMALMLVATGSYGLSAVWGRRLRGTPPVVSAAGQLICSSTALIPLALLIETPLSQGLPSEASIAAIVGLGVLSTAIAYLIFFHILSVSGPANVMLVTLLVPVSAIALGTLFLDEALLTRHIVGALVIGSGLLVIDGRLPAYLLGRGSRPTM